MTEASLSIRPREPTSSRHSNHPSPPSRNRRRVPHHRVFRIVIVEGIKSVRRYEKLMMRRIDWNARTDGAMEYDDDTPLGEEAVNKCTCV